MKTIFLSTLIIMAQHLSSGQDIQAVGLMRNMATNTDDSLFVISSFGHVTAGAMVSNESYVSTEVFPFLTEEEITGIVSPPIIEGLTVYPNPASNKIQLHRKDLTDPLLTELFFGTGMLAKKYEWPRDEAAMTISLTDVPPGIFFLVVTNKEANKRIQYKVIKQ